ncbi:zinc-binding alcohol dehydrogenase family protein [Jannaschia sp. R86511]|uniref:quinone oxidoreductase family protein n=1 Tax=Jannaschia sp. R86511 TaxID=3093853 RepID=UPI0036D3049D
MRAVVVQSFGGPEVLVVHEVPDPVPGEGEMLVRVEVSGVNYADTHTTENTYLAPQQLPLVPGAEVVGRVVRTGPGTDESMLGRRVVALVPSGGYAELAVVPVATTVEIGEDLPGPEACALVLQGVTAWHLLRSSTRMATGEAVVVHSAAGGVGTVALQLARQWNAGRVIASASTPDKRAVVADLGADVVVDVNAAADAGGAGAVRDVLMSANHGAGVDVVLEMTGGDVFNGSYLALAPLGRLVVFGLASRRAGRSIAPVDLMASSRTVAGFWLQHALARGGLAAAMDELLSMTRSGLLRPVLGGEYALADAALAHGDLRSRRTTGKVVLRA